MAFTPFNFTKSWRNASDFPTFEPDEAKVRDDLQSLFDELKVGLNRLIGELKASNMPFTATAEIDSSDVQNAIENVQSQIASALLGQLPDGSVTSSKIADGSVGTGKIADGAITSAKLDDGVLPEAGDSTPTSPGTAAPGISESYARADHVHPKDGTKADLSNGKVLPSQISKAKVSVSASKTLALTDDNAVLYVGASGACTITIPSNSAVTFPIGSEIYIYRAGTGVVTIAAAEGVNLYSSASAYDVLRRYEYAVLRKFAPNEWAVDFIHELPDGAVTTDKIGSAVVTTGKIADGAVVSEKIASVAVLEQHIASGAITTGKIGGGAVATDKIADEAVTAGKIASGAVSGYYTASINTTWTGSAAPYTKEVTITGMSSNDHPLYDLVPNNNHATAEAELDEYAKIYKVVAGNNKITLYAHEKTTRAINMHFICVRK